MEEVEFEEKVRQLRQLRASVRCRRASTPDSEQRPETRGIGESLKHQEFFSCTSRDGSGSNRSCQSSLRCQNPVKSGEQCGDLDNGRRHQFYCLLTPRCWRV
ncbi:unnamed protein product [Brassica napus]|uniref:(rape) hypothetical protein n=1 Tax=Brassica napus TaxID=3708 RepID=A0A816ZUV2_BRANA|nr:unnamed protein product [Brassica napus]